MRKFAKIALSALALVLCVGAFMGIRFYYFDGRAPESRPDLLRLPEGMPDSPKGFPTTNALYLAFGMGRIDLMDVEGDTPLPEGVTEKKDVEYGRVGDRPLVLDLYTSEETAAPAPGVLFIHGGGWEQGDKKDYRLYAMDFAQKGYVVASVGYRLKKEAKYPAAIEDTKCAVRWMRANAKELGVDPDRIAVIGGSAGGHLSMMIGYSSDVLELEGEGGWPGVSSSVRAVVDLYGPVDFTTPYARGHETVTSYIGQPYEEAQKLYEQCSPWFHLDANDPPTLILQGTLDELVPVDQSDRLAAELERLGVPVWYDRLDGWPHTMDMARPVYDRVTLLVEKFFDEYLRDEG